MSDATPMSDDDLRLFAQDTLDAHTPSKQGLNEYNRCGECNYTRHPCDVYDLAAAVLRLLDEKEKDAKSWRHRSDFGVVPVVDEDA